MSLVVMRRKVQAKQNATKRNKESSILYGDHLKCCGGGLKNNVNNKNLSYHSLMRKKVKCETSSVKLTNVKQKYRVNSRLSSSEHLRLKLDKIMYKNRLDECNPIITEKSKCTVPMLPVHYTRHNDNCMVTKCLNLPSTYKDLYNRVWDYDPCKEVENANNSICSLT
tara:strand:+ start:93 stop:593 length:501 start_codon:yes stop_codon:yes gene_type:complete